MVKMSIDLSDEKYHNEISAVGSMRDIICEISQGVCDLAKHMRAANPAMADIFITNLSKAISLIPKYLEEYGDNSSEGTGYFAVMPNIKNAAHDDDDTVSG
jgi:hypothetical protein